MSAVCEPLLQLVDVTQRFPGVVALDGVSLDLAAGEIHALVGENGAGKSTLINILAGLLQPDAGQLLLAGRPASLSGPLDARARGIVTVHQEAELFATLSVAENMALEHGLPLTGTGSVDWTRVFAQAERAVGLLGEPVDVRAPAAGLSVAQRHLTQIAAAIDRQARVLILDEPTSALTSAESEWLFAALAKLKAAGVAILYVSHRLQEVFQLADRITILRDGRRVWHGPAGTIERQQLIRHMVGRDEPERAARVRAVALDSPPRLRVEQLTSADGRARDVSFAVHSGEVLGIYGLVGSGRSELAQALFGLRPIASGRVTIDGTVRSIRNPRQAVQAGLAYLPEDRLREGVFRGLSVRANTVLSTLRALSMGLLIDPGRERRAAEVTRVALAVKCRDERQPIEELSGGNQQKVVLGRWLLARPGVLMLDEPTRGVDIGSKQEIHRIVRGLADEGTAVLLISSDLAEIQEHADRVLVFRQGCVAGECASNAASEQIAALALPEQTASARGPRDRSRRRNPRRAWSSELALALAVGLLCLLLSATTDTFLSAGNLGRLLAGTSVWCLLALGAGAVIVSGGIDISLGALLALSAGAGGLVMQQAPPLVAVPLGIAVALGVGLCGGLLNALLALQGRVHPIVITLGTMTVYRGLLIALSGGDTIDGLPAAFTDMATYQLWGLSGPVIVCSIAIALMAAWLGYRPSGRHVFALGASASAARLAGISPTRTWLRTFGVGGLLAAMAGLVELSQTGSMQAGLGTGYELQAVAAAVIGGVSISGGRGSVPGICLGALLLGLIYNALVLWQISGQQYGLVTGLLLVMALLVDVFWRRWNR